MRKADSGNRRKAAMELLGSETEDRGEGLNICEHCHSVADLSDGCCKYAMMKKPR